MKESEVIEWMSRAQECEVAGDREGARAIYAEIWESSTRTGDQYQACIAAHFMAHTYIEPEAQHIWHLRSLRAAESAGGAGDERVRAFYPSLHANLSDVYLRLGDTTRARMHLQKARDAEYVLRDDAYSTSVRTLIARLIQDIE